jgi:hypothetical protein
MRRQSDWEPFRGTTRLEERATAQAPTETAPRSSLECARAKGPPVEGRGDACALDVPGAGRGVCQLTEAVAASREQPSET